MISFIWDKIPLLTVENIQITIFSILAQIWDYIALVLVLHLLALLLYYIC